MFWAFLGGAADSLNKQLQSELQSEQEMLAYERKLEIAQKAQERAEKIKENNRIIQQGIDPDTGKYFEVTRSGERTEVDADPSLVKDMQEKRRIEAEQREIERRKAEATIGSSTASAGYSTALAERLKTKAPLEDEETRARIEATKARGVAGAEGGDGVTANGLNSTINSVYSSILSAPEADAEAKFAAERIVSSNLPLEERVRRLRALQARVFGAQAPINEVP